MKPVVIIGTDHAGYRLKERLKRWLTALGYEVLDFGTTSNRDMDYPDVVIPVAEAVAAAKGAAVGIVLGGSGNGEAMAANKVRGIRAALCYDAQTAKLARAHNDANILALGARTMTRNAALSQRIVHLFLTTSFTKEARHARRLKKIAAYEAR
ncbi:MAG: RpiB/LacA/LacB family sugar-phosphate isomerase [Patescibacteria group bacterium]